MKICKIILLFLAAAAVSCISQFTPEIVSQNYYLTVNGLVTDENRCYTIKLGMSHPLAETSYEVRAIKASVSVMDDLGNSYNFNEKEPGYYVSDSTMFTGEPGRSYTLSIVHNGMRYASMPYKLRKAAPIDSIGYEILDREINVSGEKEKIVRVSLSTFDPEAICHYFRWSFEETWEIRTPFHYLPREKMNCWISELSHNILIANTEALSEDRVTDFTLTTFNNSTDRGQYGYSMLLKQYSVSKEEYEFWDRVKTMSENTGGLYDITPVTVTGNIQCITDPNEIVLGFFSVSGVSLKRAFIKGPQLNVRDLYTDKCVEEVILANNSLPGLGTTIFILNEFFDPGPPQITTWAITHNKECADCSYYGSNVKPDYWDEGFKK